MKTVTYTLQEVPQVAQQIIRESGDKTLLFYGAMGVGKTTLIKEIVRQLGSQDNVTSPTFSLVNEYATKEGPVFHFDFYRLEDEMEALDIGIEEYFGQDAWLFIEWPDKIPSLLPTKYQKLTICRNGEINELIY